MDLVFQNGDQVIHTRIIQGSPFSISAQVISKGTNYYIRSPFSTTTAIFRNRARGYREDGMYYYWVNPKSLTAAVFDDGVDNWI